ncbi:MAG TPA: hypothetical protein VLD19_05985 [Chitinophagaceae bacterium]|nr:hypothetical protein [Chitinophagaceae bacterium]
MASSAIDKELISYFTRLDDAQKKSLLAMMKSFLKPGRQQSKSATIEEYNKELDEAMERVSRGEFTTLEALEKEMQSW